MDESGKTMAELNEIYKKAWGEGIWIKEWSGNMAVAGCLKDLEKIGKKLGKEIKIEELTLGDCVELGCPGTGKTRQEACNNAVLKFKELHHKHLKYHNIKKTAKNSQASASPASVLEGVLEFFSETGTEGGYWAFQDKKFITPNTTIFSCKKCGLVWDKEKDPGDYSTGKASFRSNVFCAPDKHEFELFCPEFYSSEGLHVLKNGDRLTIYSKKNPKKVLWSGKISLK